LQKLFYLIKLYMRQDWKNQADAEESRTVFMTSLFNVWHGAGPVACAGTQSLHNGIMLQRLLQAWNQIASLSHQIRGCISAFHSVYEVPCSKLSFVLHLFLNFSVFVVRNKYNHNSPSRHDPPFLIFPNPFLLPLLILFILLSFFSFSSSLFCFHTSPSTSSSAPYFHHIYFLSFV
jgi:hypothetical protein